MCNRLTPGQGCYAFFLNAQGRILGDVNVFCREDCFLLDTEPETRQKLFDHIDRYIIADDVTLEDATGEMATIAIEGPQAAAILERLGAPVPEADYATRAWTGMIGRAREFHRGRRLLHLSDPGEESRADRGARRRRESPKRLRMTRAWFASSMGGRVTARKSPSAIWSRKPRNCRQ